MWLEAFIYVACLENKMRFSLMFGWILSILVTVFIHIIVSTVVFSSGVYSVAS